jgi:hypothetical protein
VVGVFVIDSFTSVTTTTTTSTTLTPYTNTPTRVSSTKGESGKDEIIRLEILSDVSRGDQQLMVSPILFQVTHLHGTHKFTLDVTRRNDHYGRTTLHTNGTLTHRISSNDVPYHVTIQNGTHGSSRKKHGVVKKNQREKKYQKRKIGW